MSGAGFDADVVVVGYGPVGAMAALLLGRAGVDCDRRVARGHAEPDVAETLLPPFSQEPGEQLVHRLRFFKHRRMAGVV
jgi:flavin-dependent dehydrogenase